MNRLLLTGLLCSLLLCSAANAHAKTLSDTTTDRRAIQQSVKNYEDAWNSHDPRGLADCYDSAATWVNWFGAYYIGKTDIRQHYEITHSTYFKDTRYYTRSIEDITFLKPDIAIAHVRTGLSGDSRYPGQTFEFRRTIVMIKKEGKWLILAGQNAKLNEGVK